jgi:hypothetical protein
MAETDWMVVAELDDRSAAEERQREQDAQVRELQLAIAEDHRLRDQMRAERRNVRATLGLVTDTPYHSDASRVR